jgi:ABC-type antimicrobial peptide transport system permease subunit
VLDDFPARNFNNDHPQADRIYKVVSHFIFEGEESGNAGTPKPLAAALRGEVGGIGLAVGLYSQWMSTLQVQQPSGKLQVFNDIENVVATTDDYFRLVPYQWLAGTPNKVLTEPNQVVLTKSRADRYFPGLSPEQILGSTLNYRDTIAVTVTGIVADASTSTSFTGKEFLSLTTIQKGKLAEQFASSWGSTNSNDQVYVLLNENTDVQKVSQTINALSTKYSKADVEKWGDYGREHKLIPLAEVHFATEYQGRDRTVDKKVLYGLLGLAVFLLVLAVINYINLTTAQVPQCAREIGVRKALGSSRTHLMVNFFGETFLVTSLACGVAYVWMLAFWTSFRELFPEELTLNQNPVQSLLFMAVLVLVVSVLSGWYPGVLITRFQPTQVLRGQLSFSIGQNRFTFRKILIVFQFVIAQGFIIGAIILNQQLHYALEKDLGFDREAILTFHVPYRLLESQAYQSKHLTEVEHVSLGDSPFTNSFTSNSHMYAGPKGEIERNLYQKYVDTELLDTYGMKLIAGRNVVPSDTVKEYVLNEIAVKAFGFASPLAAIGKFLTENGEGRPIQIVGVVSDFHSATLDEAISPLALTTQKDRTGTFNVKLASRKPSDWQAGIQKMESSWKSTYPDAPFEYTFYDDMIENYYESERTLSKIINLATAVAILISCLGLFGLAALTAYQRTKEIGIRKVLGASVYGIVGLLSTDFLLLVFIALLIASPIAWYFMEQWLNNFVYRITISWWSFMLAGGLALLIALVTVSYQSIKAALMNPVKSLRFE